MAVAHSLCSAPKYVHYTHTREKEKKKYRIFYRATLNGFLFICFIRLHRIHLFIDRMCVVVFFVLRAILFDKYDLKRWCTSILFYMILCSCWCCCWFFCVCSSILCPLGSLFWLIEDCFVFFLKGFQENFILTIFVLLDVWKDLLNHRTKIHTEWDYAHSQVSTIII